ncbi:MAG: TSUP family transporter, partial [Pseudomonadota bacterium]
MIDYVLILAIVAFGASVQTALGMGLNLVAIPTLVLIDAAYAPGPILVISAINGALSLRTTSATIERPEAAAMLFGLLVGTVVAIAILASLDTSGFRVAIGIVILIAVGLAWFGLSLPITRRMLVTTGSLAGVMGTIAGIHAPPIVVQYQRASADRLRGAVMLII